MAAIDRTTGRHHDATERPSRLALLYDPRVRGLVFQTIAIGAVVVIAYFAVTNAWTNMREQGIASGFGFLDEVAGFDISQTLISYSNTSTYGRAFLVGLLNTLLVAGVGIVLATILGFVVGVMRLSPNWLLRQIAGAYIEILRNIPLLVQLIFWYFAVIKQLPGPRQSIELPFGAVLNIRGLYLPAVVFEPAAAFAGVLLVAAVVGWFVLGRWAKRRQMATGERFPVLWAGLAMVVGLPFLGLLVTGFPFTIDTPELRGFNFVGGVTVIPEFAALLLGLTLYTSAFIAEIVRAGITSVSRGQTEAARSLGLSPNMTLRLVVIPQAMRVIVPPLTSQYLNLTKNSSLAVAIGYPDLVSVFAGTVLNQTGQAVEVILITMAVYLTISLLTSLFMNWFNRRIALVER